MVMYIRLFGSLQIEDGHRWVGPDDLGGRKPKQLLEILLNEWGRVVSKDRMVDLLWPDELPQNAAATLDTYVSVLRRHLEPTIVRARDSRYLRRVHPGYLFDASEVEIDVDRFQALIVEGQHARDEGDLERTHPGAWNGSHAGNRGTVPPYPSGHASAATPPSGTSISENETDGAHRCSFPGPSA